MHRSKQYLKIGLLSFSFFLAACQAMPQGEMAKLNPTQALSGAPHLTTASAKKVLWESEPKSLGKGSGIQLAITASETVSMVRVGINENHEKGLFLSSSHSEGHVFMHPKRVDIEGTKLSAHGENGPQFRMGPGIARSIVWEADSDIWFRRSMNFGRSFLPAIKVNDDEGKAIQSFFDMEISPEGVIYVSWLDFREDSENAPGTAAVYIAKSTDGGASFSKNFKIASDVCPCCRVSIAFLDGKTYLTWRHVFPEHDRTIVVAHSGDGEKWSKPVKVTSSGWKINGCAHAGPVIASLGEKLFVVWYTAKGGQASLKMASSEDGGLSFNKPVDIQKNVLDPNHPAISVIEDNIWVAFQGRDPKLEGGWGPSQPWQVQINAKGEVSEPGKVASTSNSIAYPEIVGGNGGRVYATWLEMTDHGTRTVLCRGRAAEGKS